MVINAVGPGAYASDQAPLPNDEAAVEAFRDYLGNGFTVARSDHFVLFHDTSQTSASDYLHRMEIVCRRVASFCEVNGLQNRRPAQPFEAVCSDTPGLLRKKGLPQSTHAHGIYDAATKRSYFDISSLNLMRKLPSSCKNTMRAIAEAEFLIVQHEAAHQALDGFCPTLAGNAPDWLAEGLACAFEHGEDDDRSAFRKLNALRISDSLIQDQNAATDSEPYRTVIVQMLSRSASAEPFDPQDWGMLLDSSRWYATAWAVVFYLQNEKPEGFKRLLHALNSPSFKKEAMQKTIDRTIGPIDQNFEERVWRYVHRAHKKKVNVSVETP